MKMDNSEIIEESNDHIHIDVEDNNNLESYLKENVEVAPRKEDTIKSKESDLESYLKEELAALPEDYFRFGLIFKVSEKYRKVKEESYTPRVVSIGPLHHGKSHLQAMEGLKLRCLNKLINEHNISLKELSEYAASREREVRACYQDFKYNSKEFSKMILLDGIFIILVIAKDTKLYGEVADMLFMGQNNWMASDVKHDMLLLENQLPLFFVNELLQKLNFQKNESSYDFGEGLRTYFEDVGITHRLRDVKCDMAYHLVDFLLILHQPSKTEQARTGELQEAARNTSELQEAGVCLCPVPLGQLLRLHTEEAARNNWAIQEAGVCFRSCFRSLRSKKEQVTLLRGDLDKQELKLLNARSGYTRTSSQLQKAGVRFSPVIYGGLFNVSFNKVTGELRIPHLRVNDTTETFFRNLIALEQCENNEKFITSYIIFMDCLIDTTEDVELLVKYKIIDNLLGESHLVADLFNNLHKEVIEEWRDFYFADFCRELKEYSKDCFHQLRYRWFRLKNKYFRNRWSAISFIAANMVVVLTIIQTVCAVVGLVLDEQLPNSGF